MRRHAVSILAVIVVLLEIHPACTCQRAGQSVSRSTPAQSTPAPTVPEAYSGIVVFKSHAPQRMPYRAAEGIPVRAPLIPLARLSKLGGKIARVDSSRTDMGRTPLVYFATGVPDTLQLQFKPTIWERCVAAADALNPGDSVTVLGVQADSCLEVYWLERVRQ